MIQLLIAIVFLRVLEYYEGILFLTTNRLTTFDTAFRSRIHLALKYSALNQETRKELWKLFIAKTSKDDVLEAWSESDLNDLAKVNINGRQIKNTVRTANTLAKSTKTNLNKEHLEVVLETIRDFEEDLNDAPLDDDVGRGNGQ
jgi:SpoVK/Ycf46/Vps4 family AAA+-type ATPase